MPLSSCTSRCGKCTLSISVFNNFHSETRRREESGQSSEDSSEKKEENEERVIITLGPLNMEDMRQPKKQVAASFASEGSVMSELKQWYELYGGGSRKKQRFTYFF
ncbi:hypothetical protein ES319_A05G433700v1 [Gossypium barbadense]|uniref:Uncharacterized protein n=2 Tax=Gossypium TaxID=3633 RepID=A0A5J5W2M9_GOSBA|nr:hypothetical protein ES319_A05G433700v1 [Gossypium barbadense]TYH20866.1 hypothetical protein ES288_A05G462800v1 [Gossypium darwinii]